MSRGESNPELQSVFAQMAQRYLRLSVLADRNSQTDIVYETPPLASPTKGREDLSRPHKIDR